MKYIKNTVIRQTSNNRILAGLFAQKTIYVI